MSHALPSFAAYLAFLGLDAPPPVSSDGLARLVRAHRLAIGFCNLDVMLGATIRIDGASAFDKLVVRRRGGYCFEQNRVFGDMLSASGFNHRPLIARVRLGAAPDETTGRFHTALLVELADGPWLADAGFGGSYLPPMPLRDGACATTPDGVMHRLRRVGEAGSLDGEWLLERAGAPHVSDGRAALHGDWQPQYVFDLADVAQIDLETGNHWSSTRPGARFTTLHVASIALPNGFASMVDRTLSLNFAGETQARLIEDPEDYVATLRETFGLDFSAEEAASLPLFRRSEQMPDEDQAHGAQH